MTAFAELPAFTAAWARAGLTVEDLFGLQDALAADPDAGDVIPGGGRLRKLRWGRPGSGKRGGVRVLYAHLPGRGVVLLAAAYPKPKREALPVRQVRRLAELVDRFAAALPR